MDDNDPERRIAHLERQAAETRAANVSGASRDVCLTPDQVRNVAFAKPPIGRRGYNNAEVDMFLDLVEAALRDPSAHLLTPDRVRSITFSKPPVGRRGYDEAEVDAFLDRVEEQMSSRQGVSAPPREPKTEIKESNTPMRCVLSRMFSRRELWRNGLRLKFSGAYPALALDVNRDALSVIDLTTDEPITVARLTQVTATPTEHRSYASGPGTVDFIGNRMSALALDVPGLPQLTIAPLPAGMPPDRARRGSFYTGVPSWRSSVSTTSKYPTHVAPKADWLALVAKFGLAPQLRP